jgi:hypothetical protein
MREEVGRARAAVAAQEAAGGWLGELVLHAVLGRGGYGTVYRASWRGAPAAVKVRGAKGVVGNGQLADRVKTSCMCHSMLQVRVLTHPG